MSLSRSSPTSALYLFGALRYEVDGQPVLIHRRKVAALLAYLAVTGQPHSRDTLATLLWPESDQSHARTSLRRHLSELNHLLGEDRLALGLSNISLRRDDGLQVDVLRFCKLLADCQAHGHGSEGVCPQCVPLLEEAVAIYSGDFLKGFTLSDSPDFDDWQRYQTDSLRTQLAHSLQKLARAYSIQQNYTSAIQHARRWVAIDPLHEAAQLLLIRLCIQCGQRHEALNQLDEYTQLLEDELGVSVGQEYGALYREIELLQTDLNGQAERTYQDSTIALAASASKPLPAFMQEESDLNRVKQAPFVARDHKISQLTRFLESALCGQGNVVFIAGEAGSGKTALLHEFSRRAQEMQEELVVAQGTCDVYTGVGDPYLPFRDILNMLAGDVETLWASGAISGDHARRLWESMPDTINALLDHGPDLLSTFLKMPALVTNASALGPQSRTRLLQLQEMLRLSPAQNTDQSRLFEEYTEVLQHLSSGHPVMLLLDDLHWADLSSLSLLLHLGRRIVDSRILIVGAYRTEEVSVGPSDTSNPLAQIVSELKGRAGEIEISLDQTLSAEGRHFVDALLDASPNRLQEDFRQALFRQSRGHALFTTELLRDLQDNGSLVVDAEGMWVVRSALNWEKLPAKVEGVIEKRINRLSQELSEILTVACIEGERFSAEVVARAQNRDERELVRTLSLELERRHHLIRAHGVQQLGNRRLSRYSFRHNLFQMYLYNRLDFAERAYLHEAVGSALEALYIEQNQDTSAIAGRLARHFQEARILDKALDYRYRAGTQAVRLSANTEAVEHFSEGLTLIKELPATPERDHRELSLLIAMGVPLTAIHGYTSPEAERVYSRARVLSREVGDSSQRFPALYGLFRYYVLRANFETSHELSEQLMEMAQHTQDQALIVEAERAVGVNTFHMGMLVSSRRHLERGVALYDMERDRSHAYVYGHDPAVSCLGYLAHVLWLLGYPDQAQDCTDKLLQLSEQLLHPFSQAHALTYGVAQFFQHARQPQKVIQYTEEGLELATHHGFPFWIARGTILRGWAVALAGDTAQGIEQMRTGCTSWGVLGTTTSQPYHLGLIAEAYEQAGQVEKGLACLDSAMRIVDETTERWCESELHHIRGHLLLASGASEDEVEFSYLRAVEVARRQEAKSLELRAVLSLARLWCRQGRHAEAKETLSEIYEWFTEGFDSEDLMEARRFLDEM